MPDLIAWKPESQQQHLKKEYTSVEEYLEMENAADEKLEYYKGEVIAMSGTKVPHNNITGNLFMAIG